MNKRSALLRYDALRYPNGYNPPPFRMIRAGSRYSRFVGFTSVPGSDLDDAGDREMISIHTRVRFKGTFCGALFRLIFDCGLGVCDYQICNGHSQR